MIELLIAPYRLLEFNTIYQFFRSYETLSDLKVEKKTGIDKYKGQKIRILNTIYKAI